MSKTNPSTTAPSISRVKVSTAFRAFPALALSGWNKVGVRRMSRVEKSWAKLPYSLSGLSISM